MANNVSILMVGINGYGDVYLQALLKRTDVNLAGVVEIEPERSRFFSKLQAERIPIYSTLSAFYEEQQADLAIVSTPIHLHTMHVVEALKHNSCVLCEKPLTGDSADFSVLDKAVDHSGNWVAVGFNWSFSETMQAVKRDRIRGVFGKAKRLRTLVAWPRNDGYFNRSNWAGKRYASEGKAVFDSIANNAAAHFLHNMLYVLGNEIDSCAAIEYVDADLYKANNIETFDTCAIRVKTTAETNLFFYASHATDEEVGPLFDFEFEHATVTYACQNDTGKVIASFRDGTKKEYGTLDVNQKEALAKLDWCIESIQNNQVAVPCSHETAKAHVQLIERFREWPVKLFDDNRLFRLNDQVIVKGLREQLVECYDGSAHLGEEFAPLVQVEKKA
ncbi:oxidoreductase [Bacillus sp. JCM 19046]|nr:oxidoreductase [Bacillus sp. JCM 19045]GAF17600.1 oxidoreductase [Bacillus sp. JCM 19046]